MIRVIEVNLKIARFLPALKNTSTTDLLPYSVFSSNYTKSEAGLIHEQYISSPDQQGCHVHVLSLPVYYSVRSQYFKSLSLNLSAIS
jgi:hypothetical protein